MAIEAQDFLDAVISHDCKMDGVSRRQVGMTNHDFPCNLDSVDINGQYLVNDFEQDLKTRLNCIATIDRDVAVENLLQDLRIGHEPPSLGDSPFEQSPGVHLMRVLASDQVHRDIRVNQDHSPSP